ncbi:MULTISPECIES: hypothetical protein [unclassified Paenibacillus]|uniref:hypothetical protein n=1 Tax=unclassified Paenibacillus TaxID=185978 RepID=UPI000953D0AB|nr:MULTISPECIES: hypothetical protein [unclassified Paenibacillus]ASS66472.1 hypothetical protein CIC07_10125 [Paenibacillus sp. RUD330]SIQ03386.1 hypothetical protein SAMN05880555_0394 [Paenibacillus sp. RU4X]SIQ23140.1 hypothetical protein SAMN05880570_0394 [Paenibacillus sp. RU4T]
MKYWFLYSLTDGEITQNYCGDADEWTNIPNGCGVIGPLNDDELVEDAFMNPLYYQVTNATLTKRSNYDELRAAYERNMRVPPSTEKQLWAVKARNEKLQADLDKIISDNADMTTLLLELYETVYLNQN